MDEQRLIQLAQEGDLDAFNRLVITHQDRVYTQAYRMMGEEAVAADITQDTMITAFRKLAMFRGGSLRAWLLRIATNLCYDELRRKKRHPTLALEPHNDDDEEIESPRWLVDDKASPEESTEQKELQEVIQGCLDRLAPEFKAVVLLVDVHGMDYQEASEALGCALGTVKSRLARARLNVRNCLKTFGELLPLRFRLGNEG